MTALAKIRAISFDLDGTLWDVWSVIARAEQHLHAWLTEHYPVITERFDVTQLRGLRQQVLAQQPDIVHDPTLIRRACLSLAAAETGCADFSVDRAFAVFFEARQQVEPFQDVLDVLTRLATRYPLVALTNGNAEIARTPLGPLFQFSISAGEVGKAKPHPAMFQAACQRLGLTPAEVVHVGDDPEHDVSGAAGVGYRTIWINRDERPWPGGVEADAQIRSLAELEAVLVGFEG